MATVSQASTALTQPSYLWEGALPTQPEALRNEKIQANGDSTHPAARPPLAPQDANSALSNTGQDAPAPGHINGESASDTKANGFDSQQIHKDAKPRSLKDHSGSAESSSEPHGTAKGSQTDGAQRKGPNGLYPDSDSDENSKWIHRDKLARIESEELQAAGIFLPRQRDRARSKSQNRPRRDQSQDKVNGSSRSIGGGEQTMSRSRKNSAATSTETKFIDPASTPSYDLRRPEEIQEETDGYWVSNGSGKGSSRIPVAKLSPVPIPSEHLARETLLIRKRDSSPHEEDTITYPKTRARSGSTGTTLAKATSTGAGSQPGKRADASPKKPTTATAAKKPKPANGAAGRPKTRGGLSRDSTSSGTGTTRPSTRSGEREFSICNSKPMEGEPPWMVSAYRPDPRLPPDQQLLPTVAKRLQQEKWEREGKFGSIYDKEFRPLTDEGFLKPPEPGIPPDAETGKDAEKDTQKDDQADWPLRSEAKSPTHPGKTNSYSTMPKTADRPTMSPLPSPKPQPEQSQPSQTIRLPEPPEDSSAKKKGGCGCCIVM